jgi:hypothetical protein
VTTDNHFNHFLFSSNSTWVKIRVFRTKLLGTWEQAS